MFIIFATDISRIVFILAAKFFLLLILIIIYQKSNNLISSQEMKDLILKVDESKNDDSKSLNFSEFLFMVAGVSGVIVSFLASSLLFCNIVWTFIS